MIRRTAGWRPLALRWRRTPRRPQAPAIRTHAATNPPAIWRPQFHIHVTTASRVAPSQLTVNRVRTEVMYRAHHTVQRFFRTYRQTERVAGPVQWLERIGTRSSAVAAPERPAGADQAPATQIRRPRSLAESAGPVPSLTYRGAKAWPGPAAITRRASMKLQSVGGAPSRAATIVAERPSHARDSRQMVVTDPRANTRPVARPRASTPPDIVWRKRASARPFDDSPADSPAAPVRQWTAPAIASSATSSASSPAARAERETPMQAPAFDSRLLDRLTDDVIRRVERHVRIERERRGL